MLSHCSQEAFGVAMLTIVQRRGYVVNVGDDLVFRLSGQARQCRLPGRLVHARESRVRSVRAHSFACHVSASPTESKPPSEEKAGTLSEAFFLGHVVGTKSLMRVVHVRNCRRKR